MSLPRDDLLSFQDPFGGSGSSPLGFPLDDDLLLPIVVAEPVPVRQEPDDAAAQLQSSLSGVLGTDFMQSADPFSTVNDSLPTHPPPAMSPIEDVFSSTTLSQSEIIPRHHSQESFDTPSGSTASPPGRQYCKFYQTGNCARGDQCKFRHEHDPSLTSSAFADTQQSAGSGSPTNSSTQKSSSNLSSSGFVDAAPFVPLKLQNRVRSISQRDPDRAPPAPSSSPVSSGSGSATPYMASSQISMLTSSPTGLSTSATSGNRMSMLSMGGNGYYDGLTDSGFGVSIASMCRDQIECHKIQKYLDSRSPAAVQKVWDGIRGELPELMCDAFANYICQKVFDYTGEVEHLEVIQQLKDQIVNVSSNMHGTRAVQRLIEVLSTDTEFDEMRSVLAPYIVVLVQDSNANHVVQQCLKRFPPEYNQFIYDTIVDDSVVEIISTHKHGCCVMQRSLDFAYENQKEQVIAKVVQHSFPLVQNAYGNYVVQYVLELPIPDIAYRLAVSLKGKFIELSKQKFSSNVVEKIMRSDELAARDIILQEIIDSNDIVALLQDPFANYVVQTALLTANSQQHSRLCSLISPHQDVLRNTPYGKRILAKMHRDSSSYFSSSPSPSSGSYSVPLSAVAIPTSTSYSRHGNGKKNHGK